MSERPEYEAPSEEWIDGIREWCHDYFEPYGMVGRIAWFFEAEGMDSEDMFVVYPCALEIEEGPRDGEKAPPTCVAEISGLIEHLFDEAPGITWMTQHTEGAPYVDGPYVLMTGKVKSRPLWLILCAEPQGDEYKAVFNTRTKEVR